MPFISPLALPAHTPERTWCLPAEATQAARRVEDLGDAIAELAARLHAATYELLVLLRTFDEVNGWNNGFLSCAHWLHWRTGIDLGAAREKVRVARALASLPRLGGAMQRGELSYAKVRALTRIATPENEAQLLDVALAGTAAYVERLVRAWRRVDRIQAAKDTERRHLRRELTTWVDEDGMVVIRGRLSPKIGAVVQRALAAAADRLFRESADHGTPGASLPSSWTAPTGHGESVLAHETTSAQRRADALGLLAESALAADFDRGAAGDRYQVVLHVEAGAARSVASPLAPDARSDAAAVEGEKVATDSGQAVLDVGDGGVYVSAETSERLACDASSCVTGRTCRSSTSGARPAPSRLRSDARSPLATHAASSPVARHADATPTTSCTGQMAGPRASTTSCCSAGGIIAPCTREGWASRAPWMASSLFSHLVGRRSR
jgi:hypothetical protein